FAAARGKVLRLVPGCLCGDGSFFFSVRRLHTRWPRDWSSDVCSSFLVNWTVRIRPVRVLGVAGFGTDYDVAQGVLYAAGLPADDGAGGTVQPSAGAKIINLSLGSYESDTTLHDAIISAANAGALIVAAAGNDVTPAPSYPA